MVNVADSSAAAPGVLVTAVTLHRPTADRLDAGDFLGYDEDGADIEFKGEDEYGMDLAQ